MCVGDRTYEKGRPNGDQERSVRTQRSSEVNRDEEFLHALVSFLWRGIHSQRLGLTSWRASWTASQLGPTHKPHVHLKLQYRMQEWLLKSHKRSQGHLFLLCP